MLKTAVMCLLLMGMGSAQGNGLQQNDDIYQGDNYVDLYGLGKAFASSTWSSDYEAKNAFWVTGDKREHYWSSEARIWPVAIWFQFEQPKRVNRIKFEEQYELPAGSLYEVFASNHYDDCGSIFSTGYQILVRFEASEFAGGKELQNEKNYYCYGVRAYAYDAAHNVVALRRIQLRIEAPPNREITSELVELTNTVELLQSHHINSTEKFDSRLIKIETAGLMTCQMGYQRFTNEETATQKVVLKEISLKGFKEKPMMLVALKDITVTVGHGHSGLQAHGQVHSATSASLQLVIITAVQPRDVSITWIACGKKSGKFSGIGTL